MTTNNNTEILGLLYLVRTLNNQDGWRFLDADPAELNITDLDKYDLAHHLYISLLKDLHNLDKDTARKFWADHVPHRNLPFFL